MKRVQYHWWSVLSALAIFLASFGSAAAVEIIPFGATWEWLHDADGQGLVNPNDSDADFESTWNLGISDFAAQYDGPAFSSGPAMLGYGSIFYGPIATDIGMPPTGSRGTAYFRLEFTVADGISGPFTMEMLSDDGAVVYLDGQEILRNDFTGVDTFAAFADPATLDNELFLTSFAIDPIPAGRHVLAVAVHQDEATSPDLGFEARIFANTPVKGIIDSALSGLGSPATIVTFSEQEFADNTPISTEFADVGVAFAPPLFYRATSQPDWEPLHINGPNIRSGDDSAVIDSYSLLFADARSSVAMALFAQPAAETTITAKLDGIEVNSFTTTVGFSNSNYYGFTDISFDEVEITYTSVIPTRMRIDNVELGPVSAPFVIRGGGETYSQDFDEMGTDFIMPAGWQGEDFEGVTRRIDSLGLVEGPMNFPIDTSIQGIVNVGGNSSNFVSSGGDRIATWQAELGGGANNFGAGDVIADGATDRALGLARVKDDETGSLQMEIEIVDRPLRAFVFDWDMEIWGGDPDGPAWRHPDGAGMRTVLSVGGEQYYNETKTLADVATLDGNDLFDTEDDGAAHGRSPTLIDGNIHAARAITSNIVEVNGADGAVGNTVLIKFDANWGGDDNADGGWITAIDNVRLRALAPGDADANGVVDVADLLTLLGGQKFNQGVADVTWAQGDFNADDQFDTGDLLAMLSFLSGTFPSDPYASEAGASNDAVADVIVNSATGEVTVDLAGHTVSAIIIESAAEIFSGVDPDWNTTSQFPSTLPGKLSNVLFTTTASGIDELGTLISAEFLDRDSEFYLQDLDLNIMIASDGGSLLKGNVIVVPEPSTWILMMAGVLLVGWRQAKRSPGRS